MRMSQLNLIEIMDFDRVHEEHVNVASTQNIPESESQNSEQPCAI